jgi:hypothetical protein
LARPQRIRGAHEPLQKPAAQRRKPRLDEGLLSPASSQCVSRAAPRWKGRAFLAAYANIAIST